ncbi:surfeit locus protein [Borealophlyctis nickersoniae]|nr:surfeit locus protein [Borealophlyctis nickersoniae]
MSVEKVETEEAGSYSLDGLKERLAEHQKCFDALVQLIPPKHYLASQNEAEPVSRFTHNKKNKAPKQAVKEATKRAKKAKLDPENYKSVLDIQSESLKPETNGDAQSDEEASEEENGETDAPDQASVKPLPTGTITELREKLKHRIEMLRKKRKVPAAKNETEGDEEPPKSRQEILEKRQKRKREKKEANLKKKEKKRRIDDTTGMAVEPKAQGGMGKGGPAVKESLSFGKIDFGVPEGSKKRKGPTDLAGQVKQAEAKKQKLESLAKEAPEKAAAIVENESWNKLEKLAEGEKVKDDVKLLKKTLKRKEKTKEKSAERWTDRATQVKKDLEQKQTKREENIKKRLEEKNAPKGKGKAKGKPAKKRPGFEGGMGKRKSAGKS